jgi:hypothetical protein
MANDTKKSYPMMPVGHWWILREKFKQSIPISPTKNYLASSLDMSEASAVNNILPTLRIIGLVDKEGKTVKDLAARWRDDDEYSNVCLEIRQLVYPQELIDAFPKPKDNITGVKRWFSNHTGFGESAVGKMLSFYIMLSEADPAAGEKASKNGESATSRRKTVNIKSHKQPGQPNDKTAAAKEHESTKSEDNHKSEVTGDMSPQLHINIQIHISPESSPEQIEVIFSSMSKHLNLLKQK